MSETLNDRDQRYIRMYAQIWNAVTSNLGVEESRIVLSLGSELVDAIDEAHAADLAWHRPLKGWQHGPLKGS